MRKITVSVFAIAMLWSASGAFAAGDSGLEGQYIEVGVDNSLLTITSDHWSLGGVMKMEYIYTAKKTGDNTYEVELKPPNPALEALGIKSVVRQEGNFLFVNTNGAGETKYERKK
jgi:hypothetical protein